MSIFLEDFAQTGSMLNGNKWLVNSLRKTVCGFLLISAAAMAAAGLWLDHRGSSVPLDSGSLIRFHVIANSDSYADQALKLRVRDEVVRAVGPVLKGSGNIEEARQRVDENIGLITSTAVTTINSSGCSYPVRVVHGNFQFPEKTYRVARGGGGEEDITLPAGEYEAVRVVIGEGRGANWWCVLFPPLCFVNPPEGEGGGSTPAGSGAEVPAGAPPAFRYDYTEPGVASELPRVEYRFKVVEWIKAYTEG
ncbi:MAG: stage II sporulation protein R [Actinobacteria bacterium]|nr:stage II sporulation protein R [Actinomycetota bacterium]